MLNKPQPGVQAPAVPTRDTVLTPLGVDSVHLHGTGFWPHRQLVNSTNSLAHCYSWLERAGWTRNFELAAQGRLAHQRSGREFSDSEVYKVLEAHAWEVARGESDPAVEARMQRLLSVVMAAQEQDGYLNTAFGREGQPARYSDLEWGHELYCYGHLLQAAVAVGRALGTDHPFMRTAVRVADHICTEFGMGAREGICGHPEVELGLVEFGRLLAEPRYVQQALAFLDRRGLGTLGEIEYEPEYFQDDQPIREATVLRGHAVRALYLSAAAVDIAVEAADHELLWILERQWSNTVAKRTYITGGMGSRHHGEAFGLDWELPPDGAYCETCAGVGALMFSWRLLLATGNPRYGDFIERVLYNIIATSPAEDGRAFFYANPLHQRVAPAVLPAPDKIQSRVSSGMRAPWFGVSCCPPNVARTLASLGAYMATSTALGIQMHQYWSAQVTAQVPGGTATLNVETGYPRDGEIVVTIVETPLSQWDLQFRIPEWAHGATIQHNDQPVVAATPGSAAISAVFAPGDTVVLHLPMQPRFTYPSPSIDAVRGTVAVERGPEVFCLESVDLPENTGVDEIWLDPSRPLSDDSVDRNRVVAQGVHSVYEPGAWPYQTHPETPVDDTVEIPLIPYRTWANRGPSSMRVWLPHVADSATRDGPAEKH
ncbi:MAG: hypothetical protein CVT64_03770 [Actinobacteria bacterium HGW-Actinobacteria-4]|nr:MAG: hypothetical protein CVT64_03770 [Actinobacteria bacterium HGW-Actinobacteria-4]